MSLFKQFTQSLPDHPWKVQMANGASLGLSFTDIEAFLKILLLIASIVLTIITAYFKVKKNGADRE